jgi:probable HAF family extracellular repeat protein
MPLQRARCSAFATSSRADCGHRSWRVSFGRRAIRLLPLSIGFWLYLSLASLAFGDPAYTVTDLGTFGVKDINNQGTAVGYGYVAGAGWHVFLHSNSTTTDLGTLTGSFSQVRSINEGGVIAGWGDTLGQGHEQAFTYCGGTVTPISVSGASYSYAYDINDGGKVVGKADLAGGQSLGFLYENGAITLLPTLGGRDGVATSINNRRQIAGYSLDANNKQHVFLWEEGNMTDLGSMGEAYCYPESINERSQIVGYAYSSVNSSGHGFLYDHGIVTQLGVLRAGDTFSRAYCINELGQVVGDSSMAYAGDGRAFLYESGSMTDLNDLIAPSGWVLTSARSINDSGQIVGNGTLNGVSHAYLLTPIPEPATLALIGLAGIAFVLLRTRRMLGRT